MLRGMIGRLAGIVIEKGPEGAVIECGGVGYDVSLPLSTLAALPQNGQPVVLWIHTHVREDELKLFGFAGRGDREAFRTMLRVSGVGPKLALAILGALSGDQLARAVAAGDARRLTAIPGIGKKTAERLVLELGGRLVSHGDTGLAASGTPLGDLHGALVNLGFKPQVVDRVIRELEPAAADQPFEALLRRALALLKTGP
jgi:Holliday junction DNA helicase RuvA